MAENRIYKDLDLAFIPHPITEDVGKKVGTRAIIQALKSIVLLNYYEKPFHPEIGCNVRGLLFELVTSSTAILIGKEIKTAIKNFEPRVEVKDVLVSESDDGHGYNVNIIFFEVNVPEPLSVSFFLERLR
jgi:phage baseplate assembly protein W